MEFVIKKKLQVLTPLRLKTAVIIATKEDFVNGKITDFPTVYIHGIQIFDDPYEELYLVGTRQFITKTDLELRKEEFQWVNRTAILSMQEVRRIQRDKREHRLIARRNSLLAELDTLKPQKRGKFNGE